MEPFEHINDPTQKLEAIFHAAKELADTDQREVFLREACRGDSKLKAKVEGLLKAAFHLEHHPVSGPFPWILHNLLYFRYL